MSKTVARLIVQIGMAITLPLKRNRRLITRAVAAEMMAFDMPVETSRGRLLFHTDTGRAYHYPWFFHTDEPETLSWIDRFPPGACYWDIGANIGAFALYAALKSDIRVVAFEPAAASYATLVKNIQINGLADRIASYCLAFNDNTGLNFLNMATTEAGSSMHAFGTQTNAFDEQIDVSFRQTAIGYAVDDFIRDFDVERPTHIKIDVDSIESQIIDGAAQLLTDGPVQSVLVEMMGDLGKPRNAEIAEKLNRLGFKQIPKTDPEFRNVEFSSTR